MHENATQAKIKPCDECGESFEYKKKWQRFCSLSCRNAYHSKKRSAGDLLKRVDELERRLKACEDWIAGFTGTVMSHKVIGPQSETVSPQSPKPVVSARAR